jgi:hypothetical protein
MWKTSVCPGFFSMPPSSLHPRGCSHYPLSGSPKQMHTNLIWAGSPHHLWASLLILTSPQSRPSRCTSSSPGQLKSGLPLSWQNYPAHLRGSHHMHVYSPASELPGHEDLRHCSYFMYLRSWSPVKHLQPSRANQQIPSRALHVPADKDPLKWISWEQHRHPSSFSDQCK